MYTDKNLRFSDSQLVTTSAVSTYSVDLGSGRDLAQGEELKIHATLGAALTSGGAATIDLIAMGSSKPVTILGGTAVTVTSASPGVVTLASHGMAVGSEVFLGGTAPTGMAVATVYYVSNVTTNTFTLSTTLANAIAGVGINTSSTGTSVTISPFYVTLGSTGATGFNTWNLALAQGTYAPLVVRLRDQIGYTGNILNGSERIPRGRYITLLYSVAAAALTGGSFIADLVMDVQDGRKFYPTGVLIS